MSNSVKAQFAKELSGHYALPLVLQKLKLARSSYYYALRHPPKPTRPELWAQASEIFHRTKNGCGHRQVLMCLRTEVDCRISKKTVLKLMKQAGLVCQIRRKKCARYNSYRGQVGKVAKNVIKRDFNAQLPWQKLGTDVRRTCKVTP